MFFPNDPFFLSSRLLLLSYYSMVLVFEMSCAFYLVAISWALLLYSFPRSEFFNELALELKLDYLACDLAL